MAEIEQTEQNDTVEAVEQSIGDDLRSAVEAYRKSQEQLDVPEAPEKTDGRQRDEHGRFKAQEAEKVEIASPEAKPVEVAPEAQPEQKTDIVPQNWSAQDRALIQSLPADKQAAVVDRLKQMEAGYQPKLQEAAQLRKTWGEVETFLAPHAQDIQKRGFTVPNLVKAWAQVERDLQTDAVGTVQRIAQAYGVDLGKLASGELKAAPSVVIPDALQQKIAWLEQQHNDRVKAEENARLQSSVDQIKSFAEAKTDAGTLAHPFYAEVEDQMVALAAADRAAGRTPVLQDLYDRAVWADPAVRQKQLAAMKEAEQKKAADEAREKSRKAQKAGSSVAGSPVNGSAARVPKEHGSLRETIMAAVEDHRAA